MEVIILAGGLGTRLRSEVSDVPKPMAPVGAKPFLEVILDNFLRFDISKFVISIGYLGGVISSYFGNSYKGIEIAYCHEDEPLGTGGAIKKALNYIENQQAIIVNGDTFIDLDFSDMFSQFSRQQSQIMIALKEVDNCSRYGTVKINSNNLVVDFSSNQTGKGLINTGVYMVSCDFFRKLFTEEKFSFEKYIESNVSSLNINAYISNSYFIDMGIPEDYQKAIKRFS
ncbi:MAG: NTP transferase domain-containing protein [Gammaproteobacteria bacterium]|nr:NTP transferase domain-containing protein [Gammaproteobacteria bacterium]